MRSKIKKLHFTLKGVNYVFNQISINAPRRTQPDEADDMIEEAREMVAEGENPERVLRVEFGLEPDYVFDLL